MDFSLSLSLSYKWAACKWHLCDPGPAEARGRGEGLGTCTGKAELPTTASVRSGDSRMFRPGLLGRSSQPRSRGWKTWPDCPLTRRATLGKSPYCCEPQFPHLSKEARPLPPARPRHFLLLCRPSQLSTQLTAHVSTWHRHFCPLPSFEGWDHVCLIIVSSPGARPRDLFAK